MEQKDEQSELRKYILGSVSDSDRAAIDERLMTDDLFFEEFAITEENFIQDYVDGNLDKAERERFETCFLNSEENRQKVKFASALRRYVKETAADKPLQKKPGFFSSLAAFFSSPVPVALAILTIVGVVGFFAWRNFSGRSDVLVALNKAYKTERPLDSRISDFEYAPTKNTRGAGDKTNNIESELAKTLALKAVSENSTPENLQSLGRVYLTEKEFDKAVEQLTKAVKLAPDNAKIHNDLGVALMEKAKRSEEGKLENLAKSNEEFAKAIELDKNLLDAYFNQALCIQELNLPNQAKEAWQKYLELDPNSQWSEEARKNLNTLEANKPISKTKEEISQEFLAAKQSGDDEKAWQVLSRNREMIEDRFIPQQIASMFITSKYQKINDESSNYLDVLKYIGNLEEQKSGDLFWKDITNVYSRVNNENQILSLYQAQKSMLAGFELLRNNKYSEAQKKFEDANELFTKSDNSQESKIAQIWMSYPLFLNHKFEQSSSILHGVADYAEKQNYKWLASQSFGWLGMIAGSSNHFSEELENYKKSLTYSEKVNDLYNLQKISSQVADFYTQNGQIREAATFSQKALELGKLPDVSFRQQWRNYDVASRMFSAEGFYNTAMALSNESLELSSKEINDKILTWQSYTNLGYIYEKLGKYESGLSSLKEARNVAESFDLESGQQKRVAYIDLQTAQIKRLSNDCNGALENYEKALQFYDATEFQPLRYVAHKGKLQCSFTLQDQSAIQTELPTVIEILSNYRKELLEESLRNTFFDNEQIVYDIATDYEVNKGNIEKAIDYSEESRSRSLLDLLGNRGRLSETNKTPEISYSQYINAPLKIDEIKSQLPNSIQIVQYTILDNELLVFVISKNEIKCVKVDISYSEIKKDVYLYLELVSRKTNESFEEEKTLSKKLYRILIEPIKNDIDQKKTICFIADKFLFRLSFATLLSPETEKYLISEYHFLYSPSINVFLACTKNADTLQNLNPEKILSIGNPAFREKDFPDLEVLSSSGKEAQSIADLYQQPIVFTGADATKNNIFKNIENVDIINFAGHYIVNERSPLLSGLVLSPNDDAVTAQDSLLANYEVFSQDFSHVKLIVLSACETGLENVQNGEGPLGAARTFLAAGIPQVVASQWSVDSDSTSELMIRFHQYREKEKLSTIDALHKSQLDLQTSEQFNRPYFWGAFAVTGGYSQI